MIPLHDIDAARRRIAGKTRRTPAIEAAPLKSRLADGADVALKLECLQVTGSFKARGAASKLGTLGKDAIARGIVTASGGNHGIAVAYAGWLASVPATIYVPENVAKLKAEKIEGWGAKLVVHGKLWDEANGAAMELAAREGLAYFHPFADEAVMAGQGTVGLEILEDLPEVDTLLVAIGGGGLICGIGSAVRQIKPGVRVIGVEPTGAPTLHASLAAGSVVRLAKITTIVPTLAAGKTEQINLDIARETVERVVLIEDDDMRKAARFLWLELGIAADLSGAASVAALLAGAYKPARGERVCALVCGAGPDGIG